MPMTHEGENVPWRRGLSLCENMVCGIYGFALGFPASLCEVIFK